MQFEVLRLPLNARQSHLYGFFFNKNQIVAKVNVLAIKVNCFFMLCNEIFGKKANKQTKHQKSEKHLMFFVMYEYENNCMLYFGRIA